MLIFKKEKRVSELALQHVDKTYECLTVVAEAVKAYASGQQAESANVANEVNSLEADADRMLRDIRALLYEGAYLPTIRADLYRLMAVVDDVANKAEDCYDFVNYQKPRIPEEYQAEIISIMDLTLGCGNEFRKALKKFYKPKGEMEKLRAHTRKVSELESLIDDNERTLMAAIFESALPLGEKQHLSELLALMTCISDTIEDAADELELVSLKSVI